MKIRHKQSGVVLEGQFVTMADCVNGRNYFYPARTVKSGSEYDMTEWEAVAPEPVWRDVTAECFPGIDETWFHNRETLVLQPLYGYRTRKVRYQHFDSGCWYDAFIIERKEQP